MRTTYYVAGLPFTSELYHHGIIGQRWGVRRYQNLDGSLTPEGRKRYSNPDLGRRSRDEIFDGNARYTRDRSYDEAGYEQTEAKLASRLSGDDYKMFREPIRIAQKESGIIEAQRASAEALKKRNRNLNPFNSKRLHNEYLEAERKRKQAAEDFFNISANLSMEYINQLPKKDRDLAKRYVYILMGYDW